MYEAWVVNASPLILFARIGRLDLIEHLAVTILIPEAVLHEVQAGREKDATASVALDWGIHYRVTNVPVPASIERWDLGAGESQVLAHGVLGSRWVVLDDRAARRCAAVHNVPVIGSLGVALRSKQHGLIDAARPLVQTLIEAGMFLDDDLMNRVLEHVGE